MDNSTHDSSETPPDVTSNPSNKHFEEGISDVSMTDDNIGGNKLNNLSDEVAYSIQLPEDDIKMTSAIEKQSNDEL